MAPIENLLDGIRVLLIGYYEQYKKIKINSKTAVLIQKDFVKERAQTNTEVEIDDLHRWISLAKEISCYSSINEEVPFESYTRAKEMERKRLEIVKQLTKVKPNGK